MLSGQPANHPALHNVDSLKIGVKKKRMAECYYGMISPLSKLQEGQ
jgi:hypothetical protein